MNRTLNLLLFHHERTVLTSFGRNKTVQEEMFTFLFAIVQDKLHIWGGGTSEQVYILRNILEQSKGRQAPLYISFIDFNRAFDSITRDK